jgi:hydroxymethylpyrimidine/phosphomethylpyrimidine kinase
MSTRSPRLLTIAGSDCSGGAGIQADLKAFAAHGAYGMSVLTASTAQNTLGVRAVEIASPGFVAEQIEAVFDDLPPDGVKTGMLATAEIVETVAARLRARCRAPIVVDPVMLAASGDPLLAPEAVAALRERLAPLATLLTPNLPEGEKLAERGTSSLAERSDLARRLGELAPAVLLKGGHAGGDEVIDLLWDGERVVEIRHPRVATRAGHGTGCTLASAIAARLARGEALGAACTGAIEWLAQALARAEPMGAGIGPVDPLWKLRGSGGFA